MKVYVLNQHGEPLMPCSPRKARILLKEAKAKVVNREPFTIQLLYGSTGYKQDITVGVDTGAKNVGVSVISGKKELNSYEFKLRSDISKKMSDRKMYRRNRRRRLRHRKPRFDNRSSSRRKGRLTPSVQWKVDAHIRLIDLIRSRLPESRLILETGAFDTQKMQNPNITNEQYQKGVQYGFANVREYVLHRDGHKCQADKTGCTKRLEVHHIKFKSQGGSNAPNNLLTLCSKHHKQLHEGKLNLKVSRHKSLRSSTIMSIVRKRLLEHYPNAIETFGYVTKENRHLLGLEKTHANDAFVIAGGTNQERSEVQQWAFKRKNNRKLQISRRGFKRAVRKRRYSIQPKDLVEFEHNIWESAGVQNKGKQCKIKRGETLKVKPTRDIRILFHRKGIYSNHT